MQPDRARWWNSFRSQWLFHVAILLAVNLLIAWKLFSLEYSVYISNNSPTFMALAKAIALHPHDLIWWPNWDDGMPFQNTYSPFLPWVTALFKTLSGWSIPHSFHVVTAMFFTLGPVLLYVMARVMSGCAWPSFFGALGYSAFTPTVFLFRWISLDMGSLWVLRRLHLLVFWGEAPLMTAITLLPLAVLSFYLAITRRSFLFAVAAGISMAAVSLSNAFGVTLLGFAIVSILCTVEVKRFWRNLGLVATIVALTYIWISPLMPPSVLEAIRTNSPTVDGDYRFTMRSFWGACLLVCAFLTVWRVTRDRVPALFRAMCLFACVTVGIVWLGMSRGIFVVPQPHRYLASVDPVLCLMGAFVGAAILRRFPPKIQTGLMIVLVLAYAVQIRRAVRYGWILVRPTEITRTPSYKIANWLTTHLPGERVMVSSSDSYLVSLLTDTPQLTGGHEPMVPNYVSRIAGFAIYGGHVAGLSDGEFSELWLKALGVHAITVPEPANSQRAKPFSNPHKFDGVLPVLWRDADDTIYGVPARSASLAHVVPRAALVAERYADGVDRLRLQNYVQALDNPRNPIAEMQWENRHVAHIRTTLQPGQVISVQENYVPGWHATVNGAAQNVRADALGLIVVEPACHGDCDVTLYYDGGPELKITGALSISVTLCILAAVAWRTWRRLSIHRDNVRSAAIRAGI